MGKYKACRPARCSPPDSTYDILKSYREGEWICGSRSLVGQDWDGVEVVLTTKGQDKGIFGMMKTVCTITIVVDVQLCMHLSKPRKLYTTNTQLQCMKFFNKN